MCLRRRGIRRARAVGIRVAGCSRALLSFALRLFHLLAEFFLLASKLLKPTRLFLLTVVVLKTAGLLLSLTYCGSLLLASRFLFRLALIL